MDYTIDGKDVSAVLNRGDRLRFAALSLTDFDIDLLAAIPEEQHKEYAYKLASTVIGSFPCPVNRQSGSDAVAALLAGLRDHDVVPVYCKVVSRDCDSQVFPIDLEARLDPSGNCNILGIWELLSGFDSQERRDS